MALNPVGLALPAVRLSGGYFAARDALDTAFGDLIVALMCPVGGRFMRRLFGSGVDKYTFSPSDDVMASALRAEIFATAKSLVPTITILGVLVRSGATKVDISIRFSLASDTTTDRQKLLTMPRNQAIQFLSARSN
jgi:phage baseplate assembly protein W